MKGKHGEPIAMVARRYGYLPAAFRWRGRVWTILAVDKCWTAAGRRFFRVRCPEGQFTLEETVGEDGGRARWRLARRPLRLWLLLPRPAPLPRFPLPPRQRRPAVGPAAVAAAVPVAARRPKERLWTTQGKRA